MKRWALAFGIAMMLFVKARSFEATEAKRKVRMEDREFIQRVLRPLNFRAAYPDVTARNDVMKSFEVDLRGISSDLMAVSGIEAVEGEIFVEFVQGTPRMKLAGELQIHQSTFTDESYRAILELLEEGFMYRALRKSFIIEGEL